MCMRDLRLWLFNLAPMYSMEPRLSFSIVDMGTTTMTVVIVMVMDIVMGMDTAMGTAMVMDTATGNITKSSAKNPRGRKTPGIFLWMTAVAVLGYL